MKVRGLTRTTLADWCAWSGLEPGPSTAGRQPRARTTPQARTSTAARPKPMGQAQPTGSSHPQTKLKPSRLNVRHEVDARLVPAAGRGEACATSAAACLLHAGPRGRGRTARLTVVTETVDLNDRRAVRSVCSDRAVAGNPTGLFRATARPREFCDSAVAAWNWPAPIRGTAKPEVVTTPEALPCDGRSGCSELTRRSAAYPTRQQEEHHPHGQHRDDKRPQRVAGRVRVTVESEEDEDGSNSQ